MHHQSKFHLNQSIDAFRDEARILHLGGLSPGHGERGSARLYRGFWGATPVGVPEGRAPSEGQRGKAP